MSTPETKLSAAHAEVKAEIAHTDTKTGLLLAFIGAVLAGTWTVAKDTPLSTASLAVGGAGMALLVTAAALLLRSVRPNIKGRHGFPLWATLTAEEITAHLSEDRLSTDIAGLSRLAVAKFTGLCRAVDLTCAGGSLLVVAILIVAGGAA
ncbi:Pycsar system effector family protein [Streptomyces sp. NBC_00690]|uniref:Pycsar system effector family protein n=1 Tax=Streptomyces sp. NBC_00690 TaxID=2975808 RepID=UPI002E2D8CB8|nr:Pycsar system effector family protein [Streptomyces sp. NBC_00690]